MDLSDIINDIPQYQITPGKKKFGGVQTECLMVQCAQDDAPYLKALLSNIYANEKEIDRGMFVPSGIHLIENPSVLVNLLRRNNKFLQEVTGVAIFGMKEEALDTNIVLESGEQMDLNDFLGKWFTSAISLEKTNKTETEGKWFIIARKNKLDDVYNFISNTMKEIYTRFVPEEDKYDDFPCPRRAAAPKANTTVGSYASVLKAYSGNPQGDEQNETQYNTAPSRPKKRQAVQLLFDSETNFPAMEKKAKNSETSQETSQTNTPTSAMTDSDVDRKLAEMEARIQNQFKQLQETQATQMEKLMDSFQQNTQQMQNNMKTMMVNFQEMLNTMRTGTQATGTHATGNENKSPSVGFKLGEPNGNQNNSTITSTTRVENSSSDGNGN
jgi:hypothetical protein